MDSSQGHDKDLVVLSDAPENGMTKTEPKLLVLIPDIFSSSHFLETLYVDLLPKAVSVLKREGILSESH